MELRLKFDDSKMLSYAQRGASIPFVIYWTHGNETYPDALWSDFGAVLLSWWLTECVKLSYGSTAEFAFMEGPCKLRIAVNQSQSIVSAKNRSFLWRVPVHDIIAEVNRSALEVQLKLQQLNIRSENGDELRRALGYFSSQSKS